MIASVAESTMYIECCRFALNEKQSFLVYQTALTKIFKSVIHFCWLVTNGNGGNGTATIGNTSTVQI